MRSLKGLIFFLIVWTQCIAASCETILEYSQTHLPLTGELKTLDGFVYVDLDDNYIHTLVDFIRDQGFQEPPYFGEKLIGAHITVFYPSELKNQISEECGVAVSFTLRECQIVHPPCWQDVEEVYLIVVDAPLLDHIREKYGLPKRQYDFHITIGIKTKVAA